MMKILKLFWGYFQKLGFLIGDIISAVVMVFFYYTIFALVAILFRMFSASLFILSKNSNWTSKEKILQELKDFQNE